MAETFEFITVDDQFGLTATTQNISDGTLCYVANFRGRGLPDVQWSTDGTPSADGGIFNSFITNPRRISLDLIWKASSESAAVTTRETLYKTFKAFSPRWVSGTLEGGAWLKVTRADSSERQIECQVEGVVDTPVIAADGMDGSGYAGRMTVNLVCPYPFWYDPNEETHTDTTLTTFSGSFTCDVAGATWFMYPVITLGGPASTFSISLSGQGIAFTSAITAGETITIDLRPGKKTIVDQTGAKRYDLLNTTPSANAYQFAAATLYPEWLHGSTLIFPSYSGTGSTAATDLTLVYNKAYVAI